VPLARRFAVRASIAYKGAWVRRTRSFARDPQGARAMASADAWLTQCKILEGLPLESQIAASLTLLRPAEYLFRKSLMAESCKGSYPLEVVNSTRSPAGETQVAGTYLVLSVNLTVDDVPWLGATPMFVQS